MSRRPYFNLCSRVGFFMGRHFNETLARVTRKNLSLYRRPAEKRIFHVLYRLSATPSFIYVTNYVSSYIIRLLYTDDSVQSVSNAIYGTFSH